MTAALPSAEIIRLPAQPRPRTVAGPADGALAANGIRGENRPPANALGVLANRKPTGGLTVLDRLLADGTLDARQHAAALAYGALRRRYERSGIAFRAWREAHGSIYSNK